MALFKRKEDGVMDVIRCDEPSYLIWKWRPTGVNLNESIRENAIRWGSSLRVKDGSLAVFVYKQKDGTLQDFIEGPYDGIIKTSNLPVLASVIGLAYNGSSPFQAEIYFINLAEIIQTKFAVPFFDVYDPRFLDFGVPVAVRGTISFRIADYKEFIKLHRLDNFEIDDFKNQIKDAVSRYIKAVIINMPYKNNIPVLQIERMISQITEETENELQSRLKSNFGVWLSGFDISAIEIDKESEGYCQLKRITQDVTVATVQSHTEVNIKNMQDMQRINAENTEAILRAQREEAQYAWHKQTQSENMDAYRLEQQAAVGIAGANALGQLGANGAMEMAGGGMNPAMMMTGMAIGGAIGQNMSGIMNNMMVGLHTNEQSAVMPSIPETVYNVAVGGQPTGPYNLSALSKMASDGRFTKDSLVWKAGMSSWERAEMIEELRAILYKIPPIPPV